MQPRSLTLLAALTLAPALLAQERQPLTSGWRIAAVDPPPTAAPSVRRLEFEFDDGTPTRPGTAELDVRIGAPFESVLGTGFDGIARYEQVFAIPEGHAGRVRIEFDAVATEAVVSCNGIEVGRHLGGWTPFRVDVTDTLRRDRPNLLEVLVDEKVGHNTQGFLPVVQPHFGGIWQGVTLALDSGPVLDRIGLFTFGEGDGTLRFSVPALDGDGARVEVELVDGESVLARTGAQLAGGEPFEGRLEAGTVERWAPGSPKLYVARIRLLDGERELDRVERKVGFRDLEAQGTRVLWNGAPLQLRGVLHWGYSPPHLAPPVEREFWRRQLSDFAALGFNCVKACLWVPPRAFYELCDELGLIVWQEYPTWHPTLDQAHKAELLAEYAEFFAHDRSHPSVAIRSITCETGHGADFDVVRSLYEACKAAVPDTLVVDDSSWIGWQRISDFWDEHPYGNNSWFPGRLEDFRRHIAEKGAKPLLLGECIAADTWLDTAAWRGRHGDTRPWWQPTCLDSQIALERWLADEFGPELVPRLLPRSLDFGLANRKFQIEQLRLRIPEAGYVVSVARDIPKCRMGLYDEFDRLKWAPEAWNWHGDTMLCLDLPWNGRAVPGPTAAIPVVVSHHGAGALRGRLSVAVDEPDGERIESDIELEPGTASAPLALSMPVATEKWSRMRVRAELSGTHAATNEWTLWRVPATPAREPDEPPVLVVDRLTIEVLDELERGARVLLTAGDRKGSLRTEAMWFLKGAPFVVPHPFHERVPADALLDLAAFDFESGRVMPWDALRGEVDPILAFWETHDIPDARLHLHAFDCRVGAGRLLATTLRIDGEQASSAALRRALELHLASGAEPRRALSPATIAALRATLTERKLDLPLWRFRTDAGDEGRTAGWHAREHDDSGPQWRDLRAGQHWENQAADLEHYTGIAWYRVAFDVPADWEGLDARAVFEGVDDSFDAWLDGEPIGKFGDEASKTSIWLERQVAELGKRLAPGPHVLALRVVDHVGAGGLWRPVFLTTGPVDARSRLLH